MNVDELRSVLRTERQKDSLQHLRESFYGDVAEFIAEQKADRERTAERLGTHYSPEIRRITDEIETAEEVVTSIYERRVGKVVKAASFAAAGMSSDTEGMTHEEERLFSDLVDRIEENRTEVLSTLEDVHASDAVDETPSADRDASASASTTGAATTEAPTTPPAEEAGSSFEVEDVLSNAMGGGPSDPDRSPDATESDPGASDAATTGSPDDAAGSDRPAGEAATAEASPAATTPSDDAPEVPPDEPDEPDGADAVADDPLSAVADDRETVRITADVGTILGVDEREYELAREDVVTLPSANADPLVERGAAERLE